MLRLAHLKALGVRRDRGGFCTEPTMHEPEACCSTVPGEVTSPTRFSSLYQIVGLALLALTAWVVAYSSLVPFAETLFKVFPLERQTMAGEAVYFFLYEAPKVILLLTLVVFVMGWCVASFHRNARGPFWHVTVAPGIPSQQRLLAL